MEIESKKQLESIQSRLQKIREAEIEEIVARLLTELGHLGISRTDLARRLGPDAAPPARPSPPKFRDPATGKTWSGRGRHPKWFSPERIEAFTIEGTAEPQHSATTAA